jgi:hypothetical protein
MVILNRVNSSISYKTVINTFIKCNWFRDYIHNKNELIKNGSPFFKSTIIEKQKKTGTR